MNAVLAFTISMFVLIGCTNNSMLVDHSNDDQGHTTETIELYHGNK